MSIKLYTAFTKELDDPEAAVLEITEQLNPKENMMKNTIGIVNFFHEFVETGVYSAIVGSLPFDVVGSAASLQGTGKHFHDFGLSVTMLTSDDADFSIQTLEDVDKKSREQIFDEVTVLFKKLCDAEKPKMVLALLSPTQHFSGSDIVTIANGLADPFPLFGTIAFSGDTARDNYVAKGSVISETMYVFITLYGDVQPNFRVITSFAYEESFGDVAKITDSEGPILRSVNGISALEYLKKQGMINATNNVANSNVWAIPAILTLTNGTKVARAFFGIVEGTESIYSAGNLEVGAKITFAFLDGEKTLVSAEKLFAEISEANERGVIAYSCAARSWSLGTQQFSEYEKIADCVNKCSQKNNLPVEYSISCSAGEICPVWDENGKLVNTFHNYTLISCSFC